MNAQKGMARTRMSVRIVKHDVDMMKPAWFISCWTRCCGSQYPEIGMVERMVVTTVAIVRQMLMALITYGVPLVLRAWLRFEESLSFEFGLGGRRTVWGLD